MANLQTTFCGIKLNNPVLAASGTFGYGLEFSTLVDLKQIGGLVVKGLSIKPISGNPSPRVTETASGMLNSIGLQNVGVKSFVTDKLPKLTIYGIPVLANVFGFKVQEYVEAVRILEDAEGLAGYELNVSCPNTQHGGLEFGADAQQLHAAVTAVKAVVRKRPLIVKLSPNVTDIASMARAAEEAGADGLSLINTLRGLAVDANTFKPILSTGYGGLSGPAIKPVALYQLHKVYQTVNLPILGMGGIACGTDVVEFMLCGATGVQVGTASFWDPARVLALAGELNTFLDRNKIENASDLKGALEMNTPAPAPSQTA